MVTPERPGGQAQGILISVVTPVHGDAQYAEYLLKCLDSVLGQAAGGELVPPVEMIAVDDASPGGCGAILDARARLDPRLRVIHLEANVGPGRAREIGAEAATGEYVWFVDGDDELAEGALAAVGERLAAPCPDAPLPDAPLPDVLLPDVLPPDVLPPDVLPPDVLPPDDPRLDVLRPDVLLVDYENVYPAGQKTASESGPLLRGSGLVTLADKPEFIRLTMTSWSKLFRREFLSGLGVPFGPGIHEDVPVSSAALLAAERIATLDRVCYRYRRQRRSSFMATPSARHFDIFASYARVFAFAATLDPPVTDAVHAALFERAVWHFSTILPLVPRRRRKEFFRRMSSDFQRFRPPVYVYPRGARGLKFRLIGRDAYAAYSVLEPLNQGRVTLRRALHARR
jgi:CDP-glycerol glycerophosphotransferase